MEDYAAKMYQFYTTAIDECILKAIEAYRSGDQELMREAVYLAEVWKGHRQCVMEVYPDELLAY